MATRTSLYGSVASMIPDWVFGGEYGDLTKLMNNRELSYEQLWQQQERTKQEQQQTLANDLMNQKAQRELDLANALDEQFSSSRPANLRDAYESMMNVALDSGDAGTAMKAMGFLNDLDQKDQNRKISILNQADNLPYSVLRSAYGETLPIDEATANSIYNRRRPTAEGSPYIMQAPDGKYELVPRSQFNEKAALGYKPKGSGSLNPFDAMLMSAMGVGDPSFVPGEEPAQAQKTLVENIQNNAPGAGAEIAQRDMYLKKGGRKIFVKAGEPLPK